MEAIKILIGWISIAVFVTTVPWLILLLAEAGRAG